MSATLQSYLSLGGRILLSVIFLLSGVGKIMNWAGTANAMEAHGMTSIPFFLTMSIFIELLGGLALLFGFQTRFASLVLFLFMIPVMLVFHHFWDLQGSAQHEQMINFLKNVAIMGGLLEFCAVGAGALSIDAKAARSRFGRFRLWRGA
jgi:putative oxidoreductase